jgi:hypothetical protein
MLHFTYVSSQHTLIASVSLPWKLNNLQINTAVFTVRLLQPFITVYSYGMYICMCVYMYIVCESWDCSVSIVFDYRLDDRGSIAGRGNGLYFSSSLCVQTSSEAHPASFQIGNPTGGKARPERDADQSPFNAYVKN